MKEIRTLNGKFDARCKVCFGAVYRLWVDKEPPPSGCTDGRDHEPWKCSFVYNRLVSIVIRQDHLKKPLDPEQEYLLALLGPHAERIMQDIRAHREPPHNKPLPPDYSASRTLQ